MMDHFREDVATKRNTGSQSIIYVIVTVMMFVFALIAFTVLQGLITRIASGQMDGIFYSVALFLLTGGPAVLAFLRRDYIKTEFEYTFTNGALDFAMVLNNKRRKALGSMDVRKATAFGKVTSGAFQRYSKMQGIKQCRWFVNREAELYFFYVVKESGEVTKGSNKRLIIFEPTEEMVEMIKVYLQRGVLQVN